MYSVTVTNKGDYAFEVRSKDYEFIIDIKGAGINPPDTLLASLASCVGVYVQKYLQGSAEDAGAFTVKAEAELSQEKPISFRSIVITITLQKAIEENRKKRLLEFVKNCPVHNTLHANPEIEILLSTGAS